VDTAITIKGTRDGLLIDLGTGDMAAILVGLTQLVEGRNAFFRGGKVALQAGDRKLTLRDVIRLRQTLEKHEVAVWAIVGTDPTTIAAVEKLGLETMLSSQSPSSAQEQPPDQEFIAGTGLLLKRTLRSGQSVSHAGHVVVIGDVNPGAEVIAGGDIVVWGHLRGIVHAGATGDQDRCVCALDLSPTQLRIGNHIARPPEGNRRRKESQPERAFISDGQIIAERWT
jgi:septum site-determining protein MinC